MCLQVFHSLACQQASKVRQRLCLQLCCWLRDYATVAQIIRDPDGRSKGFGFLYYEEESSAADAIEKVGRQCG